MSEFRPVFDLPEPGTPEYEHLVSENKGPSITIACWFFTVFATVFVVGRLFVRWRMHRKFLDDDYWCVAGLACAYGSTALCQVAVNRGNGRHFPFLSTEQQEDVIFWTIVGICPGVLSLALPKFAVVSLLSKLLNPKKYHRWFLWALAIICTLSMFAVMGTLLGQCQPMESQWNFDMKGSCVDKNKIVSYSVFASVFSAFVDFYLAVYPAVVLFGLQMKLQKKLILVLALGIGLISGAMAIYKATKLHKGLSSADFSYDSSDLVIWTIVEGATIIIACTIPVLGPLTEFLPSRKINPFRRDALRRLRNRGSGGSSGSDPCTKSGKKGVTDMDLEETIVGDNSSQDGFVPKGSQDGYSPKASDDPCANQGCPGGCKQNECGTRTEVRYSANMSPTNDSSPPPPLPQPNHIIRTSEVHVSYTSAPFEVAWPPKAQQTNRPPSSQQH